MDGPIPANMLPSYLTSNSTAAGLVDAATKSPGVLARLLGALTGAVKGAAGAGAGGAGALAGLAGLGGLGTGGPLSLEQLASLTQGAGGMGVSMNTGKFNMRMGPGQGSGITVNNGVNSAANNAALVTLLSALMAKKDDSQKVSLAAPARTASGPAGGVASAWTPPWSMPSASGSANV